MAVLDQLTTNVLPVLLAKFYLRDLASKAALQELRSSSRVLSRSAKHAVQAARFARSAAIPLRPAIAPDAKQTTTFILALATLRVQMAHTPHLHPLVAQVAGSRGAKDVDLIRRC